MQEFLMKYKYICIVFVLFLGVGGYNYVAKGKEVKIEQSQEVPPLKQEKEEPVDNKIVIVDVKGAVVSEGVYELKQGERVKDAIHSAGGFTENADSKAVNLAALVVDEMVVYVPQVGEEGTVPSSGGGTVSSGKGDGKISLNKATSEELQNIPGIGPPN